MMFQAPFLPAKVITNACLDCHHRFSLAYEANFKRGKERRPFGKDLNELGDFLSKLIPPSSYATTEELAPSVLF